MSPDADTRVSLREYIETIFRERKDALDLAFKAQQDALGLASRTLELRLEKLNELRQEVTTDRGNYVLREKYEADLHAINEKLDASFAEIRKWQDRADGALNVARFLGASGVVALIVEIARASGALK